MLEEEIKIKGQEEYFQIVAFKISNETYGVMISEVYEIIRMQTITRVPNAEKFIEGVINLRGKIIPVIDLRKRFELPSVEGIDQSSRVIMIVKFEEHTVGMIVDGVSEVLQISTDAVENISSLVTSQVDIEFISGIAKVENKLIILLNLQKVLTKKEKLALREIEPQVLSLIKENDEN